MKLKSQTIQPTTREENGRRIYTWKTSNLDSVSAEEQKAIQSYDAMRGLRPPSDVLMSSFRTWEEVGRWYEGLQRERSSRRRSGLFGDDTPETMLIRVWMKQRCARRLRLLEHS